VVDDLPEQLHFLPPGRHRFLDVEQDVRPWDACVRARASSAPRRTRSGRCTLDDRDIGAHRVAAPRDADRKRDVVEARDVDCRPADIARLRRLLHEPG
jgi:hypothetical protein